MDPARHDTIVKETDDPSSSMTDDNYVDTDGILKSGTRYKEQAIDFGKNILTDEPFEFTLTLDALGVDSGTAELNRLKFTLNFHGGVHITTAGTWYQVADIAGRVKAETGSYTVYSEVSQEMTQELGIGISASAMIAAAPLGVGAEFTVGASLSYTLAMTSGTSSGGSVTHNISVDKGEGCQGWSRGGWVSAKFPLDLMRDKGMIDLFGSDVKLVADPQMTHVEVIAKEACIRSFLNTAAFAVSRKNDPNRFRKEEYVGVYPLVTKHLLNTYYKLGS